MRAIRDSIHRGCFVTTTTQHVQNPSVWRSVDDIDAAAWNQVRDPDDLFRVLESTLGDQTELWYVLIRDSHREPVAIACLYTLTPDAFMMAQDCWSIRIQKQIQKVLPALFAHKVLACGMPLSAAQNYLRIAPHADHRQVLETLDRLMLQLGREVGAKYVMLKEFSDDEVACLNHLSALGYRRADSLPQNVVHPQQSSFDDFRKQVVAPNDRWSIRKSLKKAADGGITTRCSSNPEEITRLFTDDVHALYASVFGKASRKLEWLPAEFFLELARQLPEHTSFCFLKKGDQVLAFIASVFSRSTYYPLFLGVDYTLNPEYDLYFNVVYGGFSDGLSRGAQTIEMGQTCDFFKCHKLGCHQSRRSMFIKGTSRFMHWLMLSQFDKTFPPQPLLHPSVASPSGNGNFSRCSANRADSS